MPGPESTTLSRTKPPSWSTAASSIWRRTGRDSLIEAPFFIDATPYGDLLALAGVEHVLGAESRSETGEPHAAERADPRDQQAITVCFAVEYRPGEDHTIDKPRQYAFWREFHPPGWPGPLLSWTTVRPETHEPLTRFLFEAEDDHPWWRFRRILDHSNFDQSLACCDITVVDWHQNDYWFGPLIGVDAAEQARNLEAARQLSLSLLYWLQTEAPRPDGGVGYPGLRLRGDVVGGTPDGLAQAPYVRESRRIRAELTVLEQHIAHPLRPDGPELFPDSVGIGSYRIDLHPRVSGAGYLDLGCWPFQIPLGAMIPVRVGFTPTERITMSEPGREAAATIQKAADEMSPGTSRFRPDSRWRPFTDTERSRASTRTPNVCSARSV